MSKVLVFLLAISSPAVAENLPEFEGVYLRTVDGTLHELPQSLSQRKIAFGLESGGGFGAFIGNYPSRKPAYLLDVWKQSGKLPIVDGDSIKSIVVNSRDRKPEFLNLVVFSQDFFGANMKAQDVSGSTKSFLARQGLEHPKADYPAIDSDYGYPFSKAKTKNIDTFNTEFFLGNIRWEGNKVPNAKESGEIPTIAFSVKMSDGHS